MSAPRPAIIPEGSDNPDHQLREALLASFEPFAGRLAYLDAKGAPLGGIEFPQNDLSHVIYAQRQIGVFYHELDDFLDEVEHFDLETGASFIDAFRERFLVLHHRIRTFVEERTFLPPAIRSITPAPAWVAQLTMKLQQSFQRNLAGLDAIFRGGVDSADLEEGQSVAPFVIQVRNTAAGDVDDVLASPADSNTMPPESVKPKLDLFRSHLTTIFQRIPGHLTARAGTTEMVNGRVICHGGNNRWRLEQKRAEFERACALLDDPCANPNQVFAEARAMVDSIIADFEPENASPAPPNHHNGTFVPYIKNGLRIVPTYVQEIGLSLADARKNLAFDGEVVPIPVHTAEHILLAEAADLTISPDRLRLHPDEEPLHTPSASSDELVTTDVAGIALPSVPNILPAASVLAGEDASYNHARERVQEVVRAAHSFLENFLYNTRMSHDLLQKFRPAASDADRTAIDTFLPYVFRLQIMLEEVQRAGTHLTDTNQLQSLQDFCMHFTRALQFTISAFRLFEGNVRLTTDVQDGNHFMMAYKLLIQGYGAFFQRLMPELPQQLFVSVEQLPEHARTMLHDPGLAIDAAFLKLPIGYGTDYLPVDGWLPSPPVVPAVDSQEAKGHVPADFDFLAPPPTEDPPLVVSGGTTVVTDPQTEGEVVRDIKDTLLDADSDPDDALPPADDVPVLSDDDVAEHDRDEGLVEFIRDLRADNPCPPERPPLTESQTARPLIVDFFMRAVPSLDATDQLFVTALDECQRVTGGSDDLIQFIVRCQSGGGIFMSSEVVEDLYRRLTQRGVNRTAIDPLFDFLRRLNAQQRTLLRSAEECLLEAFNNNQNHDQISPLRLNDIRAFVAFLREIPFEIAQTIFEDLKNVNTSFQSAIPGLLDACYADCQRNFTLSPERFAIVRTVFNALWQAQEFTRNFEHSNTEITVDDFVIEAQRQAPEEPFTPGKKFVTLLRNAGSTVSSFSHRVMDAWYGLTSTARAATGVAFLAVAGTGGLAATTSTTWHDQSAAPVSEMASAEAASTQWVFVEESEVASQTPEVAPETTPPPPELQSVEAPQKHIWNFLTEQYHAHHPNVDLKSRKESAALHLFIDQKLTEPATAQFIKDHSAAFASQYDDPAFFDHVKAELSPLGFAGAFSLPQVKDATTVHQYMDAIGKLPTKFQSRMSSHIGLFLMQPTDLDTLEDTL